MAKRLWLRILTRLVESTRDSPRTTISSVEWTIPPRGETITDVTEQTIRSNEGESWQPPPPARRDPWRPNSNHW